MFLRWPGAPPVAAGSGRGAPDGQVLRRELQNAPDSIPDSGVEPPPLDTAWVEATRKKALLKLEKLDTDLKNYKGNSIKESIRCCSRDAGEAGGPAAWPRAQLAHVWAHRRGHDDLGDHYLDCGDLSNALKCYSRARDYCTSAKHVINMCLNVIKVGPAAAGCAPGGAAGQQRAWASRGRPGLSPPRPPARQVSVYLQNWSHVLSYVSKAESTPEIAEVTPTPRRPASSDPAPGTPDAHGPPSSAVCPRPSEAGAAPRGSTRVWRVLVAHVLDFPLQQRGERDSQTQAILTKLKCAAGEGPGARGHHRCPQGWGWARRVSEPGQEPHHTHGPR